MWISLLPDLSQEAVFGKHNRHPWPYSQKHLVVCYDITKNNIQFKIEIILLGTRFFSSLVTSLLSQYL